MVDINAVTHALGRKAGVQVLTNRSDGPGVSDVIELEPWRNLFGPVVAEPLAPILIQS